MRTLDVQVDWIPVKNRDGSIWTFPTPYASGSYAGPAVYRWRVLVADLEDTEFLYIGETQSLMERAKGVLKTSAKPKSDETNARLNAIFGSAVANGSVVTLETAVFDEFSFNGVVFSPHDLFHEFKRKALENLFLSRSLELGEKLLNLYVDPDERWEKQVRGFSRSPQAVKKMMEVWSPSKNSEEIRQRFYETHVGKK